MTSRSSSVASVAMLRLSSLVVMVTKDRSIESVLLLLVDNHARPPILFTTGVTTIEGCDPSSVLAVSFFLKVLRLSLVMMPVAALLVTRGGVYAAEVETPPGNVGTGPFPSGRCGMA